MEKLKEELERELSTIRRRDIEMMFELFQNKTVNEHFEEWLNARWLNSNNGNNESLYEEFEKNFITDLLNNK